MRKVHVLGRQDLGHARLSPGQVPGWRMEEAVMDGTHPVQLEDVLPIRSEMVLLSSNRFQRA